MPCPNRREVLAVVACSLLAAAASAPSFGVVYGTDDRMEPWDLPSDEIWARVALRSNVALIQAASVSCGVDDCVLIPAPTLGEYHDLCADERFYSQLTSAFCSGFLVDRDLLVTAGHCVRNAAECGDAAFVFGYRMLDAGVPQTRFPKSDVYRCQEIVARVESGAIDWAVLRMDRPVDGLQQPLPLRREGAVELDDRVAGLLLIGHPSGIPVKIAGGPEPIGATGLSGATVREALPGCFGSDLDAFTDDLDTFGGNSGSAVVSLDERGDVMQVEGVLARAPADWIWDEGGSCNRVNVCDEATGCLGLWAEVTRATEFAWAVPPACGDGRCDGTEDELSCPSDCLGDLDGDGVEESLDNCPGLPNPDQGDVDGDRAGDPCDCDPADPVVWGPPGEVRQVRVARDAATGESVIQWFPPGEEGSTVLAYDVLRSEVPFDFLGPAVCVESDDGTDRVARDGAVPGPGTVFHYLVRAQNACPAGEGTLGWGTDGTERLGAACPLP